MASEKGLIIFNTHIQNPVSKILIPSSLKTIAMESQPDHFTYSEKTRLYSVIMFKSY